MRKFFLLALVLSGQTTLASSQLPGTYDLTYRDYERKGRCNEVLVVTANENYVELKDGNGASAGSFYHSGCKTKLEGQIGIGESSCNVITEDEAYSTHTGYLTIVGFIHEFKGVRLENPNSDVLIHEVSSTLFPFGFIALEPEVRCYYKRR